MNKSILIGVIGFFLLTGIVVTIWNCGNSESYWPQTDYTYTYVYNGKESKKSPILSLGPKNDKSKNPEFTLKPLGNYTINMYRRVEGKDWELLGNIPAGQTSYKDTTPPIPPIPPVTPVTHIPQCDDHCTESSDCSGAYGGCTSCVGNKCTKPIPVTHIPQCDDHCTEQSDCSGASGGCTSCVGNKCTTPNPSNCLKSGNPFGPGGTCEKSCCKNTCFKDGSYFCSDDQCQNNVPTPLCCPNKGGGGCGECNTALCKAPPPPPSPSGYVFNYDKTDNHLGIKVDKTKDNYFFILGDWGAGPTGCEKAQQAVANKMLDYYNKNKNNKNLLFVLTLGDNFYWTGLDRGDMFENTWSNFYKDLCNYKWLSCMGNHDWGDNDSYCVCPSNKPYKEINGQKYQCNQLNSDKGGYRPPGTENYYLPDFGYHYTINDLDLEIIVTSQTGDGHSESTGGASNGRPNVEKHCGGEDNMTNKLTAISNSGKDLITSRAHETKKKNVIIAQHYDDLDESMHSLFTDINKSAKVISAAGHVHDTYCAKKDGNLCTHVISGGGGGCCLGHPACTANGEVGSGAGFFVVNIDASNNMTTEQIMVGGQQINEWGWVYV